MLVKPEDDMSRPEASGAAVDAPPDSVPDSVPDSHPDCAPVVACVRALVQESGLRLSPAAIRELTDRPAAEFGPLEAVSALRNCGFDATGGKLPARRIAEGHCPLIAFRKDGAPMVVFAVDATAGTVTCGRPEDGFAQAAVPAAAFAADYAGFAILAKNRPDKRAAAGTRNWFWNALGEGRWLYAQVLVAAAMSNILGLSSALFIMVVYDRVVPNEAIESLIALTVGVLIALGFDFVIKTLRANFIDKAGKRADLRMSRMIFDKILSMRLEKRSKRSGALASIVREFETLRDFFTSATLVTVVDLPFVFFFIWVISLIAGPLALVPLVAVPLVIVTGLVIQPFLARLTSGSMETTQSKQAVLVETLNGIETVQATGAGRLMRQRFEDAVESQSELGLRSRILSQFAVNSAASVQQLCQIGIIFYGVFLIQEDVITMGAMIAAVILSGRTLAPLTQLAAALSRANNARQAYRALNALMTEDADTGRGVPLSRPSLNGSIELHEIGYRFPGSSSLLFKDLSLTIPAGQKVAILGRMGSDPAPDWWTPMIGFRANGRSVRWRRRSAGISRMSSSGRPRSASRRAGCRSWMSQRNSASTRRSCAAG